ncbi:MAG: hybrid sensor histidine kinase/response regulator [Spirochaetota bacterium]
MEANKNIILLVDDTPSNLKILVKFLDKEGYDLRVAMDGKKAIEIAEKSPPDLILLDVMMQEMDGYETCRKMKEIDALKDIPIIFLTALSSVESQIRAFEAGGVDFIAKPLRNEEVLIRIRNHLKIKNQQELIKSQLEQMKHIVYTKERLFSLIAHDIRSPVATIYTIAKAISVEEKDTTSNTYILMHELLKSSESTMGFIDNLLKWANSKSDTIYNQPQNNFLYQDIDNTLAIFTVQAKQKSIAIHVQVAKNLQGHYDQNLFFTVVRNLVSNSIKFTNEGGTIHIVADREKEGYITIKVADNGVGMAEASIGKLFQTDKKFHTKGTSKETGSGFGLIFSKEMVEKMGGEIWVMSKVGQGTDFYFTVPLVGKL